MENEIDVTRRQVWREAKSLAIHRLGAMTNAGLSHDMYIKLRDDIAENFDIAAEPKGIEWLYGKCSLEEFYAAN